MPPIHGITHGTDAGHGATYAQRCCLSAAAAGHVMSVSLGLHADTAQLDPPPLQPVSAAGEEHVAGHSQ